MNSNTEKERITIIKYMCSFYDFLSSLRRDMSTMFWITQ